MKLTVDNLHEILRYCFYYPSELREDDPSLPPDGAVLVEGVIMNLGFHPGRLEEKKPEVQTLINQLPEKFQEGESFLNMCEDREGNQWGEHQDCDALLCIALGCGLAEILFPRGAWPALPGGVPFIQFQQELN